jgi:DNA mismatch repair protein MutS
MFQIKDLQFEKEILPLFDFVYNEYSRKALIELLSEIPDTATEVMERTQILKGLMNTKALFAPFSYYKSEVSEVVTCLEDLRSRQAEFQGNLIRLRLLFASKKRKSLGARLFQVVHFFQRIHLAYFSLLDEKNFPDSFGQKIKNIQQFLLDMNIAKYREIAKKRRFNFIEISDLCEFLIEKSRNGQLDLFLKDFFCFEAYHSISKGIIKHQFTFPHFDNESFFISGLYHPFVKNPVKNDLILTQNVTLITGPNMSGKSTLLKAVGICVLLARMGLAVPAAHCRLPFFDSVFVCVNLNDDLKRGFSHFMTEIKSLKDVLTQARGGKSCFAVFDEIFRGTNAEDALAISKTTVLGLTDYSSSWFLISTHLYQLKEDLGEFPPKIGTQFIECKIENNTPVFTYQLLSGWSELKIGQLLFELEGLDALLRKGEN